MVAYWKDRDGNKMNYWPGGKGLVARCDKAMVRLNKKYVLSKFMDKDACMPRLLGMY